MKVRFKNEEERRTSLLYELMIFQNQKVFYVDTVWKGAKNGKPYARISLVKGGPVFHSVNLEDMEVIHEMKDSYKNKFLELV